MRLVHHDTAGSDRRFFAPGRRAPGLVLVAMLIGVALAASGASAAVGSTSRATANFCGLASGVSSTLNPASEITPTAATTSLATLESRMKTAFEKVESEEPMIISAAPSQIQGDIKAVFAVDNVLIGDLKKANWNFMALAADAKTLEASVAKIKAPVAAIEAYFKAQCH